jgi:cytochrome c553
MGWCCNYDYKRNDQDIEEIRNDVCYSNIYLNLTGISYLKVYVLKKYTSTDNTMIFTENEIVDFCGIFNKMHLYCTLNINDEINFRGNETSCYSFDIDMQRNKSNAVRILMNIIRFIYEICDNNQELMQSILKYCKEESNVSFWNIMCVCHSLTGMKSSGHNFVPPYSRIADLSDEEILKQLQIDTQGGSKIKEKPLFTEENQKVFASMKDKSITELYEFYKNN